MVFNVLHSPQNKTGGNWVQGGGTQEESSSHLCCWHFALKILWNAIIPLVVSRIVTTIYHIWENDSQKTTVLFSPDFYLQTLCGSVKAHLCLHGPNVCHVYVVERIQLFVLYWYTVSSGEKASFQKGSPDICCIVEYGVSGTMLISCVNRKNKGTAKSTFWITAVILLYLHVFKVKLSKHPFAYLYHDF